MSFYHKYLKYKNKYILLKQHGGISKDKVLEYKNEITMLYNLISSIYSPLILSGSSAIFFYLTTLNYVDLIDKLVEPNDVDFLLIDASRNPLISREKISDFTRNQRTLERSATFTRTLSGAGSSDKLFNSFDLTIVSSVKCNKINDILIIDLQTLKSKYLEDVDLRSDTDSIKIEIIDEIIIRLAHEPHNELIKFNYLKVPSDRADLTPVKERVILFDTDSTPKRILFDSDTDSTPKKILFSTPKK